MILVEFGATTPAGAACDVPAALYSYSFATDHAWKHRYAQEPEILDYLHKCATDFGVIKRIRFDCDVCDASFDNDENVWSVTLTSGDAVAGFHDFYHRLRSRVREGDYIYG